MSARRGARIPNAAAPMSTLATATPLSALRQSPAPVGPRQPRALLLLILGAHLLAVWGLLQMQAVRSAVMEATPLFVDLLGTPSSPAAAAPSLPPPAAPQPPQPAPALPPVISAAPSVTLPTAEAAPATPPAEPSTATTAQPVVVSTATAAVPAAPAAAEAAGPRQLPPSAAQFVVAPQAEYPRASRRLKESGRVLVSVFIDEAGLPRQVLVKTSSGFALLDEAALAAVRKARFKPYMEHGQPQAGWVVIPMVFDLER